MNVEVVLREGCLNVRNRLAGQYDVNDPESRWFQYRGLCDKASVMLRHRLEYDYPGRLSVRTIHGEQKHTTRISSDEWLYQHTWLRVTDLVNKKIYYVDPTASQFQDLYPEIPDYYVDEKPPVWFLEDSHNFVVSKLGYRINDKIRICKHGIVDIFEYVIYGGISDGIRWLKGKVKRIG